MKIAFLTDGIPPYIIGGMQKHSLELAKELVLNGMDVDLFHFVQNNEKIPSFKEVNKLVFNRNLSFNKVYCTNFPSSIYFPGHYIWNSYKYSKWIFKIIYQDIEKYDFIYAKGFSAWKLLRIKRRKNLNTNIGIKFHGYEMFQRPANFRIKLEYLLLRPFIRWNNINADYVFSYGGKITSIIKSIGVSENKIIEIPSGIQSTWIRNKVEIPLVVKHKLLFIGRNERRKAYIEICNAIKKITDISLEFHFIGPFSDDEKFYSNNHKIIYHGLIKDNLKKRNIIDQCDILLCPSYSEGMPNVILESMSRGLSIIASNVGAVSELVNYKNGVLLDSNTSNDILNAIVKLLNLSNDDFLKMRLVSIDKIEVNYVWSKLVKKLNLELQKLT
jgi:glycosyltransferase involved in cell wall biosynthesis